jgi:hypothetical protein
VAKLYQIGLRNKERSYFFEWCAKALTQPEQALEDSNNKNV